ncbi:hypothetical protein Lser_V15G29343 [Lactuca serriola]
MKTTFDDSSSTDDPTSESPETEVFEDRLSQVRLRYCSGTGKKVYARKSKKSGTKSGGSSGSRANMYLPSVPLKEPISVILVGDRKDSTTYVRNKKKACDSVGIISYEVRLAKDSTEEEVVNHISKFNDDPSVHGILVQLPLLRKDVDGFHPQNVGRLAMRGREPSFVPYTPKGCIELLHRYDIPIKGKRVVVIGRSNIVGTPAAFLLQFIGTPHWMAQEVIQESRYDGKVLGLTAVTFSSKHDVSCFAPDINVPSQFMSNLIDDSSSSELLEGTQI